MVCNHLPYIAALYAAYGMPTTDMTPAEPGRVAEAAAEAGRVLAGPHSERFRQSLLSVTLEDFFVGDFSKSARNKRQPMPYAKEVARTLCKSIALPVQVFALGIDNIAPGAPA